MSGRLDVWPILKDHWGFVLHGSDKQSKKWQLNEFIIFVAVPIIMGVAAAVYIGMNEEFIDFTMKLSILMMPLMLNLLFTLYRCMQDEAKAWPDRIQRAIAMKKKEAEEAGDPGNVDLTIESALNKESSQQRKVFQELCSHVLYLSLLCFLNSIFFGLLVALRSELAPLATNYHAASVLALSLLYAVVSNVLLTAVLVIRKSYVIMKYSGGL